MPKASYFVMKLRCIGSAAFLNSEGIEKCREFVRFSAVLRETVHI